MFLTKLALRNLFRHKKRTFLTASLIALAVFIYIMVDSLMVGLVDMSYDNIINLESGHLQITTPAYWDKKEEAPLKNLITYDNKLIEQLKQINDFKAASPELRFSANLNNGVDELPVMGLGVKPAQLTKVLKIDKYLLDGEMFAPDQYEAVMGKSLADLMEFKLGDYTTLLVRTKEGTFNTIDVKITGLLKTPSPEVNGSTVYLPLSLAQQALNLEGKVSQLTIRLNTDKETAASRVDNITTMMKNNDYNLKAYSWKESAKTITAMNQAQNAETAVMLGIILILAAVGIINTVILSALERLEEIGMMKALGMKEGEIIRAFVIEATGIGILGGVIGCLIGLIGVGFMANVGLSANALGGPDINYGLPILEQIYGGWNPQAFIFVFSFGVVIALLSSILPARWAARKDPVKSIYHR